MFQTLELIIVICLINIKFINFTCSQIRNQNHFAFEVNYCRVLEENLELVKLHVDMSYK